MIPYDKYGKMTPEFSRYQQAAWDDLRARAEAYTELAIKDGVCPNAMRDTMKMAMECGSVVACAKAYTKDHTVDLPSNLPRGGMGV